MPYKVLGQSTPAANTDTTLYTVPASTETVVSSVMVANTNATAVTVRLAVRPNGAAIATQHYLYYDVEVSANATLALTAGITMDASDVVTVRASATGVAFSAFGREIA